MFRCSGVAITSSCLRQFVNFEVIMLARINLCIHPFQLNTVVTPLSRHCVYIEGGRYQERVVGDE